MSSYSLRNTNEQRFSDLKLTSHVEYSARRAHDDVDGEEEEAAILNRARTVARSMEDGALYVC